jgi:hypothetical protein
MANVKLKEAIKGKQTITIEKKPALYASKCDCCGLVFQMEEYCNDKELGYLKGTFDNSAIDSYGKGMGNMFSATVCSFKCADEIMKGGWKRMKDYKPYIKSKANLVRCEVEITAYVIEEKELIKKWEAEKFKSNGFSIGAFQ